MRPKALISCKLAVAALVLFGAWAAAQGQPPQGPPPPPAGAAVPGQAAGRGQLPANQTTKPPTAIIRGQVMASDGRAIRSALVNLISAQPVIPGGVTVAARENRTAATDPVGRFEFKEVPAGRYRIAASKTGFVRMEYGQRVWDTPGTQVEVADAQTIERIDFAMQRGGVIVVTATNPRGEPMAGADVQAMQYRFLNGRRTLQGSIYASSDDRGRARLYGLAPGEYFVNVTAPYTNVGTATAKTSYVPTYYPGTLSATEAVKVPVAISQETHVTIPLVTARLATLSGRATRSDGTPLSFTPPAPGMPNPNGGPLPSGLGVVLRQEMPGGGFMQRNIPTKPDGTFSIPSLVPGSYQVQVRPIGNAAALRETAEFASVPVTIDGADVSNLAVSSKPGANITGQVVFDTGAPPTDKTAQDLRVFVYASMVDPPLSAGMVTMKDDYSFEIRGVAMTGMVRLFVANTGWNVKEEIVDGKDIVEAPITWEPGRDYKDIRVVLTQKRAEITGTATDGVGRPVKDYVALAFPQDTDRWVPRSLSILQAHSDQNGQFRISRLPGAKYGQYNVIALEGLQPGQEMDFELLAKLAPLATKITVGETEVKSVTLRVQEVR